jgi:hypothetical protein
MKALKLIIGIVLILAFIAATIFAVRSIERAVPEGLRPPRIGMPDGYQFAYEAEPYVIIAVFVLGLAALIVGIALISKAVSMPKSAARTDTHMLPGGFVRR